MATASLNFCTECGGLRLRDVKDKLQRLFDEKSITQGVCSICKKTTKSQRTRSSSNSSRGSRTKPRSAHSDNDDTVVKIKQEDDYMDVSLKETKVSECDTTGDEKTTKQGPKTEYNDTNDPDYPTSHHKDNKTRLEPVIKGTRLSTGAIKPKQYQSIENAADADNATTDDSDGDVDFGVETVDSENSYDDFDDTDQIAEVEPDGNDDEVDTDEVKPKLDDSQDSTENASYTGTNGLDPEILELFVKTEEPNRPYQCKFCTAPPFRYVNAFLLHVKQHTGKEPMEKPFKCNRCNKNVLSAYHLGRHHKKLHGKGHRSVKRIKCKTCGKGFTSKNRLAIHETLHSGERPITCDHCSSTFSHVFYRDRHQIAVHNDASKYKCDYDQCSYTCGHSARMKHHKDRHKNMNVTCKVCQLVFKYQYLYERHAAGTRCKPMPQKEEQEQDVDIDITTLEATKCLHPKILELMGKPRRRDFLYRCKLCKDKEFVRPFAFIRHMQEGHQQGLELKRLFFCNLCDNKNGFRTLPQLKAHKMTHSVVRLFKCPHPGCDKDFKSRGDIQTHQLVHKERQHMCSTCGSRFVSATKLRLHDSRIHLGLRPFKCVHCGHGFSTNPQRVIHQNSVHLKLRPYVCEVCGRSFAIREALVIHNRSHTGEKPYSCPHCAYRCVRRDYLRKHLLTHSKEKPLQCIGCGMRFALRTSLVLHQRKCNVKLEVPVESSSTSTTKGWTAPTDGTTVGTTDGTIAYSATSTSTTNMHPYSSAVETIVVRVDPGAIAHAYPDTTTRQEQPGEELSMATDSITAILKLGQSET